MVYSPAPSPASPGQRRVAGPPGSAATGRTLALMILALVTVAGLAVAVLAAVLVKGRAGGGPDPYAGAYPVVTATPTPAATVSWAPSARPAGRLRPFPGKGSKVTGRMVDKSAGLSFARLGAPWKPLKGIGTHTGGQEYVVRKPDFRWLAGGYSSVLYEKLAPAATGPQALRAAAELTAQDSIKNLDGRLTPIAGQPLKVGGHPGWLAAYRANFTDPYDKITERTMVVIAVDTGRRLPGVLELSVAKRAYRLLPDLTTLIKSLKVVR